MIETSDSSDIHHLGNLVATLLAASDVSHHHACHKQLSFFKALYDVAIKYLDVKNNAAAQDNSFHGYDDIVGCTAHSHSCGPNAISPGTISSSSVTGGGITGGSAVTTMEMELPAFQPDQEAMGSFGGNMNMNHAGDELARWYYTNHQLMRMLGDL
jgi:hypothetical protein